jgi:hypothetical protein
MSRFVTPGRFRQASSELVVPENSGLRFILNPINTKADFDNEINLTLSKKWRKVREDGKGWYANRTNFKTGECQSVAIQSDVWVINFIILDEANKVIEGAFEPAMKKIAALAKYEHASIHISSKMMELPGFEAAAQSQFIDNGMSVYVYSK